MSDNGGSDLDVFDGLAKKRQEPSSASAAPPPPPMSRQKTLLGLAAPTGGAPPPPPSTSKAPPPPPPSTSKAPPPPPPGSAGSAPVPPPPGSAGSAPVPPPPGSAKAPPPPPGSGSSAPVPPPPGSAKAPPPPPGSGSSAPIPPPPGSSAGRSLPPPPPPGTSQPRASLPPPPPPGSSAGAAPPPSAPLPPPPGSSAAAAAPPAAKAPVDIDWDDEDEKTSVYDKDAAKDTAADELRKPSAGEIPKSEPPTGKDLPRTEPPSTQKAPSTVHVAAEPAPPQKSGSSLGLILGLVAVVAVAAAAIVGIFLMSPSQGGLVVTVAGPGGKKLDVVKVLVDQKEVPCDGAKCEVKDLEAGPHMVQASAAGYEPSSERAVAIDAGKTEVLNLTLAAKSAGTGIKVAAKGKGLKIYINGEDKGPLPFEQKDMVPGSYKVKIDGGKRLESYEQEITVAPDQVKELKPELKVIKGLAKIEAGDGADDAKVLIVIDGERRKIEKLPQKLDVDTSKKHVLIAKRDGYVDFSQKLEFEPGEAEKTFTIEMLKEGEEPPPSSGGGKRPAGGTAVSSGGRPKPKSGSCKLNINSLPASAAIVDGVPRGRTPIIGVTVSAGSHTVIFVHPEKGRKVSGVNCPAGGTATAAVRF